MEPNDLACAFVGSYEDAARAFAFLVAQGIQVEEEQGAGNTVPGALGGSFPGALGGSSLARVLVPRRDLDRAIAALEHLPSGESSE